MRKKSLLGFTLVELLVVVVVVGIISTVAFPQYQRMQEVSRVRAAYSKLEVIRSASKSYFTDFNTYAGLTIQILEAQGYIGQIGQYPGDGTCIDRDWIYSINPVAVPFTVTALRRPNGGAFSNTTIILDRDTNLAGSHPLVGQIIQDGA